MRSQKARAELGRRGPPRTAPEAQDPSRAAHAGGRRTRAAGGDGRTAHGAAAPTALHRPWHAAEGLLVTVAVVIAAYNAGEHIDATLASLASQVLRPCEIIVVDDASSDDTVRRAGAWADRLPITLLQQHTNAGPGAARRRAMSLVRSRLVVFVDADDVLLPDHLRSLVDAWQRRGGVVSPRAWLWDGASRMGDYHRSLGLRVPRRRQLDRLLEANYVFYGSIFDRRDYERVGGMRPLRLSEDWDLWVRLASDGVRISCLDRPTVLYRRHAGNASQDAAAMELVRQEVGRAVADGQRHRLGARRCRAAIRRAHAVTRVHRGASAVSRGDLRGLKDLGAFWRAGPSGLHQVLRRTAYLGARRAAGVPLPRFRQTASGERRQRVDAR